MHRMVEVTVDRDRVVFEIEGWDKLWSLRSRLEIPLAHMTGVEAKPDQVNQWWPGLKVMGTALPGLFAASIRWKGRYWMRLEWRAPARARGASGAGRAGAPSGAAALRSAGPPRFPRRAAN